MMKFFKKPNGTTMKIQILAFVWILICTALVQIFNEPLASIGIHGWTIFVANVLFFIKGNPNQKEGLLEDFLGGIFGLIGTFGTLHIMTWLVGLGVQELVALLIPIAVFLFLSIGLHPLVPYVFNTIALCFFTVGFLGAEELLANPWGHFAGVLIGNVIVNVGIILIARAVTKSAAKKAAK